MRRSSADHIHVWKSRQVAVPVRKAVNENGKLVLDVITAKDLLLQWVCDCGAVVTYDLERRIA